MRTSTILFLIAYLSLFANAVAFYQLNEKVKENRIVKAEAAAHEANAQEAWATVQAYQTSIKQGWTITF